MRNPHEIHGGESLEHPRYFPVKKVVATRLPGQYLEHRDMDRMTSTVRVFARAKPEDKLDAGRCYAVFFRRRWSGVVLNIGIFLRRR